MYRGTRDGFEPKDFHQHCDQKAKTITFVKTSNNQIFGGFTNGIWSSEEMNVTDNKAFLFSVNHMQKYFCQKSNGAIYNSRNFGPCFGQANTNRLMSKAIQLLVRTKDSQSKANKIARTT